MDWNAICRSDTVKGSLPDRQKGPADLSVLQRLSDGYCSAGTVLGIVSVRRANFRFPKRAETCQNMPHRATDARRRGPDRRSDTTDLPTFVDTPLFGGAILRQPIHPDRSRVLP